MKKYVCVKDSSDKRANICLFSIENTVGISFDNMAKDIQDKGNIQESRVCYDVALAMEVNNIPSNQYVSRIFNLEFNEKLEFISSKKNEVGMAPANGSNYPMEEDDFYDVQYYRYFLHPLITIYNDLNKYNQSFIQHHIIELVRYASIGTDNERYYANAILSTIHYNDKDLDNRLYQLLTRLSILMKHGFIYNDLLTESAIPSDVFKKASQKTKK